jgi:hypothetical protein
MSARRPAPAKANKEICRALARRVIQARRVAGGHVANPMSCQPCAFLFLAMYEQDLSEACRLSGVNEARELRVAEKWFNDRLKMPALKRENASF